MPSRGNYEITSREDGKVAQRDESYKSCIIAMLIFLLLSIVLIVASLPWKKFQTRHNIHYENDKDSIESARINGQEFTTTVETVETSETVERKNIDNEIPFERYISDESTEIVENNFTTRSEETSREIEEMSRTIEETSQKIDETERGISTTPETFSSLETTITEIIRNTSDYSLPIAREIDVTSRDDEKSFAETFFTSIRTIGDLDEKSSIAEYTTNSYDEISKSARQPVTTRRSMADFTSLQRLLVAKYFGNESTSTRPEDSMDDWLNEMQSRKNDETTEFTTSSSTKIVSPSNFRISTNSSTNGVTISGDIAKKIEATTRNFIEKATIVASQDIRENKIDVCQTGSCKQMAGKILSRMNHSADPCDDFYEYACGGLEADRQINEKNLLQSVYEKIQIQARKDKTSKYTRFNEYYESCLKYESNFDKYHRVDLAKESLEKVGKFYHGGNWPGDFQGLTTLFANMLLRNRPLLFDIVPDVNEKNPETFTLKIGPAIDSNPFQTFHKQNMCNDESSEILQEHVDLGILYETYKKCRQNTSVTVIAISQALKDLGIFEELKYVYNITLILEDTVTNIYHEIIEGILSYYPPDSEIRESYRSKQYTVTTLGELEATCKLLNWKQLIKSLTGLTLGPSAELQIYYKDEFTRALRHLEEYARKHELELNNALLGLYARNLYQDLVVARSARDLEKKCLNVVAYFMRTEASLLYMSSFSGSEIHNMKTLMRNIFHELRETLRIEIKKSEWTVDWGREVLIKKLDDMRMSIPDVTYINNNYTHELNMTDNYFENSMNLMKKYRFMMYSVLQKNPNDPEQIWNFFASPHHSNPRTIYGLNLIVIPFGAIDWPMLSDNFVKLDYTSLATIGNLIAREIAHNFDANGIRYWNGSRDSEFALMTDGDLTKTNYEDYINCQRYSIYQEPLEILLPVTGQRLTFRIPSLTLNDRLSDGVGMRLAHDTLARLSLGLEKRLPWLDLNVSQLFYLVYAQTHCTKASLISSYVSLYENPLLPSRIRVFVAASNNKNLGESWKCPEGSQLLPTFTCGIFPHLEYQGVMPDPA